MAERAMLSVTHGRHAGAPNRDT